MKKKHANLEHGFTICKNCTGIDIGKLEIISEAWSLGDYRIWFETDVDAWGNPQITISASRQINHDGVNITRDWLEVRKQLEQGNIPDWLVETALKGGQRYDDR